MAVNFYETPTQERILEALQTIRDLYITEMFNEDTHGHVVWEDHSPNEFLMMQFKNPGEEPSFSILQFLVQHVDNNMDNENQEFLKQCLDHHLNDDEIGEFCQMVLGHINDPSSPRTPPAEANPDPSPPTSPPPYNHHNHHNHYNPNPFTV